jgi:hypothetical protein
MTTTPDPSELVAELRKESDDAIEALRALVLAATREGK